MSICGRVSERPSSTDAAHPPLAPRRSGPNRTVSYTIDVYWKESATPWATRWDAYLRVFDAKVHVFALVNSIVVVSFLCLMVAMILMRNVTKVSWRSDNVE